MLEDLLPTSIVGLSQLGNKVSFIGKVNDDELGNKYEESLVKENVTYFYNKKKEDTPTGTCLILITPDSERTMCTFLGIAGKISEQDIQEDAIKQSELVFLEGYLWDEGDPKAAFEKAFKLANKTAMSLSDQFCVERHKTSFLDLVKNKLDITFANEQEIIHLIGAKSFDEVLDFGKNLGKLLVITRSDKGSVAIHNSEVFECESEKNLTLLILLELETCSLQAFYTAISTKCLLKKAFKKALKWLQKLYKRLVQD